MNPGGGEIAIEGLTWRPLRRRQPVLRDLNLHVPAGQRVLLVGPSGAGKSTLLRAVAGLLETADSGERHGEVRIDGRPVGTPGRPLAGLLLQDPAGGRVAESVGREIAFGLENQQVPRPQIWERVRAVLSETGFPYGPDRRTNALSGGEAQRLALAATIVLGSPVLLLDEPTAMLDPAAAAQVRGAVRTAIEHSGQTAIIVEHRIEPWLDFADRMIVLGGDGRVVADGVPGQVLADGGRDLAAHGVWVPGANPPEPLALDPELVRPWEYGDGLLVRAAAVTVRFGGRWSGVAPTLALARTDAAIAAGRALAITGPSGSGKSTLLSVLCGLRRPTSGTVTASGPLAAGRRREPWRWHSRDLAARFAWAPQLPEHGVIARTVREEVRASGRACGRDGSRFEARADGLLEALGLAHLAQASPYHLSGGEQRRLLLAAALAHGPSVLALDEPTVGQDRLTWAAVVGACAGARGAGAGVAFAGHDAGAVAALADDTVELRRGAVTA